MACDLRIVAENASFSLTSSRIGTIPGAGGTQRLPRLIGVSAALDIIFSGEPIDGPEAYRLGAVNRLVPPGTTVEAAKKLIAIYAQRAPLSLAMAKSAVRAGVQIDMATALEFERHLTAAIYGTADKNEGISAFLEKRPPIHRQIAPL